MIYCFIIFLSFNLFASIQKWTTIEIPGAKCGDGSPYKVFLRSGDSKNLAVEFMGGGACWDFSTCWGPVLRTWIHPIPKIPTFSYLSSKDSPLSKHTFLYLPYCTGDVFAGNHVASYPPIQKTYHEGGRNIKLAIQELRVNKFIQFNQLESLIIFGSSAGGIGALLNRNKFDDEINVNTKKVLIADSVGLHFGLNFWKKFSDNMLADFHKIFAPLGVNLDENNGMIASQFDQYCKLAHGWRIGFIQKTKDVIMSTVFGQISQEEHRAAVLGPYGIKSTLKNSSNCSTHISEGRGHALLIIKKIAEKSFDTETKKSAIEFTEDLINDL